ncbi:5,6-dimethylbenzimidazole synthase [Oleiphilus sp. HI0009]|uniref:5,6-dimethylbenzimidazole synthase n=3 Tax=Oleiphilus TaxID=141450 RepID=UPI0007C289DA|nr:MULTISPECIES: 5,6-dimethylbenzimidazole synthase [unclassified Oleiphilus]KZX75556.1 5,6-dimethylbenzimidazole synthase [Oleiphilus sp. HI0009]MCH2159171.1 5,6-dimethylbenzimidazole synthase [Oleiphilaceae bacterium]KZY68855.1 5,6-dimethylbenzimidazole synthase [Oleiphilus sp. HI0067]KZY69439.1 5,6-dimethylbenzimidazole synthase [Oleiphilus sp. HI0066]KZY71323.1 5,6-dimethylbenzimidazole synthase [Oleiphilus sp. HI0066]
MNDSSDPTFSYTRAEKTAIYKVMAERRDMRHFNNEKVSEDLISKLLYAAHMAPSVGLMQPWRFIRIRNTEKREAIQTLVENERDLTAAALASRKAEFLKLKVEGLKECSDVIVAALPDKRDEHVFGRRTLPEMDLASLSCAIQNMWLAARAEGIGMGWVSIFDPEALKTVLNMPPDSHPVAILCIGHVDAFYEKPMLVMEEWATERSLDEFVFEDEWQY